MDAYKAQKKKNEITEDDLKEIEKDIQDLTDMKISEVEKITDNKQKEIMSI
jgi:ribosome recycling factor